MRRNFTAYYDIYNVYQMVNVPKVCVDPVEDVSCDTQAYREYRIVYVFLVLTLSFLLTKYVGENCLLKCPYHDMDLLRSCISLSLLENVAQD